MAGIGPAASRSSGSSSWPACFTCQSPGRNAMSRSHAGQVERAGRVSTTVPVRVFRMEGTDQIRVEIHAKGHAS